MYFNNNDDERNKLNPANWSHLSTRDHLDGMLSGKLPVQRNQYDVNKGKSPYYYLDEEGNEYDRPVGQPNSFGAANAAQPQNTNYGMGTMQNGIENRFNSTMSNPVNGTASNPYPQFNKAQIVNSNQNNTYTDSNWFDAAIKHVTPGTYALGELAADAQIAVQEKNRMDDTGRQLVNMYGNGAAKDIDNYYHPLLQCNLAKISPESRQNGLLLGVAKEYLYDYPKKSLSPSSNLSQQEIWDDMQKDLQNNEYGSQIGQNNLSRSCVDLLEHLRTRNMRRGRFF